MREAQVLIVDDDEALLQALPDTLRLRLPQVRVEACDSAQAALARIRSNTYHAIISDLKMPGMDGLALLHELRQLHPHTPLLLITGLGEEQMTSQAVKAGVYDFIRKPIDRDEFVLSIQRALEVQSLRRQVEVQEQTLARLTARLAALDRKWLQFLRQTSKSSPDPKVQAVTETSRRLVQRAMILLRQSYRRRIQFFEERLRWTSVQMLEAQVAELRRRLQRQEQILEDYWEDARKSGNLT